MEMLQRIETDPCYYCSIGIIFKCATYNYRISKARSGLVSYSSRRDSIKTRCDVHTLEFLRKTLVNGFMMSKLLCLLGKEVLQHMVYEVATQLSCSCKNDTRSFVFSGKVVMSDVWEK